MKTYKVGVDLGGTNIAVGVLDENNQIIGRGKVKTNAPRPAKEIAEDIVKAIFLAVEDAGIEKSQVASVGIGTPGTVNRQTGVIEYANNLQFHQVPMVAMLKEMFDVPYAIENDANAAALGEALAGGMTVEQYEEAHHMVAEGAQACRTLATLSNRFDVELPIANVVRSLVWEGADPSSVAQTLLSRSPKPEFY